MAHDLNAEKPLPKLDDIKEALQSDPKKDVELKPEEVVEAAESLVDLAMIENVIRGSIDLGKAEQVLATLKSLSKKNDGSLESAQLLLKKMAGGAGEESEMAAQILDEFEGQLKKDQENASLIVEKTLNDEITLEDFLDMAKGLMESNPGRLDYVKNELSKHVNEGDEWAEVLLARIDYMQSQGGVETEKEGDEMSHMVDKMLAGNDEGMEDKINDLIVNKPEELDYLKKELKKRMDQGDEWAGQWLNNVKYKEYSQLDNKAIVGQVKTLLAKGDVEEIALIHSVLSHEGQENKVAVLVQTLEDATVEGGASGQAKMALNQIRLSAKGDMEEEEAIV